MCAIGGWISGGKLTWQPSDLTKLMASMRHRGPDDSASWFSQDGRISLGHNRLSIIDLSAGGRQPMLNEQNGDVLVFNGEIYNFQHLRVQLEHAGYIFRTKSDTEVLLYALGAWGIEGLSRVEGMYAFAWWRAEESALYLVRDPIGIKPLYTWSPDGHSIAFASELKAFRALPGFVPTLDRNAVGQFLEFGYTFDAERTCLEGVAKLPPGCFLRMSSNEPPAVVQPLSFYKPAITGEPVQDGAKAEEELYETLSQVVREHLNADVPVGLLLSGGLDSSLLASLAARSTKVRTISMGFGSSSLDERPHARRVAEYIGSDHEEVLITPTDVQNGLAENIAVFDDLFADWGVISTRLLYGQCRERGIKVVIVGEGSDELFGGYDVFQRATSKIPTELWLFQLYRYYSGKRYGRFYREFRSIMMEYLTDCRGDRFSAIRLFETRRQLPNNYVMKVDKASMAVSVEARVPFLDRRIADIAWRTPASQLTAPGTEKILLRRVAERFALLPPETLARRKMGGSMASSWMDDLPEWRNYAKEIILADGSWTKALGLEPAMSAYFIEGRSGYAFPSSISIFRNLAWRLLILELWTRANRISPSAA